MELVEAIYHEGVFKPLSNVSFKNNQRVRLSVESIEPGEVNAWIDRLQEFHKLMKERHGTFPDSTLDIAEDRMRDV